jgi:membrane protease YdiL (CAAX protease family)
MTVDISARRRNLILLGLLLALGLPFCHLGDLGRKYTGLGQLAGGEILWWVLFAIILGYVANVENESLSSIGFRTPRALDIVFAVVAALVMFMGIGMIYQFLLPALHLSVSAQLKAVVQTSMAFRLLTVTRAAVVEETAFRGYGFERLAELTGSRVFAALATWALFTVVHLSGGGAGQMIIAAFGGLVLTALYYWRGNLWANIIAHWLTDGAGFILLPLIGAHH